MKCGRKDCAAHATTQVFLSYAGIDHPEDGRITIKFPMPLCDAHVTPNESDYMTDDGFAQISTQIVSMNRVPPDRSSCQITTEPFNPAVMYGEIAAQFGQAAATLSLAIDERIEALGLDAPPVLHQMRGRASEGAYSEFFGVYATPMRELYREFTECGQIDLAERVAIGVFDADTAEREKFSRSQEYATLLKQTHMRPLYSDVTRKGRRQPWRNQ